MADFEGVKALRGQKLAHLKEHVRDVLALELAPEDEYRLGALALASYEFVPWALSGLAAAQRTPASGGRAGTTVTVPLGDDKGGADAVARDVTLLGPGDVLGIEPGQIVRRYPPPGSVSAEETFHAHIEFDRPELPWSFSARTPEERMPAWLALVVFERGEVRLEPGRSGLPAAISAPGRLLPSLAAAWAWAHAQAPAGSASLSARLSTAYGQVNGSRLLAARLLTEETDYLACLVPTTEAGRKAGLGLGGDGTLGPAWTGEEELVRLPVYDHWTFRTAPDGDFARLARRLEGVAAPWQIGRRTIDCSRPGEPLDALAADAPGRRQTIRCALYSPARPPADAAAETAAWSEEKTDELRRALERPALLEGSAGVDPGAPDDLPIVGPRIYAKGQRGSGTIAPGGWFAELNLKPANRVAAGLGTRVVQKDQEELMQAAWAQVGEVEKANRELALAELARHLAAAVHSRLGEVDPGRLLQMTRPLAERVRLDGAALTLAGQTARSATPAAALGGSFRRALRPTGPISRRLGGEEREALSGIAAVAGLPRDFARPYVELDGIRGLSRGAIESLDAAAVSTAIGVPPEQVGAALGAAADRLRDGRSLATAVSTPSAWGEPEAGFRPGAAIADRVAAKIREHSPEDPARDVVGARWLGGLAAALADSGLRGSEGMHDLAVAMGTAVADVAGPGVSVVSTPAGSAVAHLSGSGFSHVLVSPTLPHLSLGLSFAHAMPPGDLLSERAAGELIGSIMRPGGELVAGLEEPAELAPSQLASPQAALMATWLQSAARVTVADVRAELAGLIAAPGALELPPTPARDALAVRREQILARLEPKRTVIGTTQARLSLGRLSFDPFAEEAIRPIMAAPRFDRPMYQALDGYDREWLVPGLGELPAPELVTLLAANDVFTEAFLIGLSDEAGRELLWREYPTDARGTYFHRFWDGSKDELTEAIHRFAAGAGLGAHLAKGPPEQSGRAVVVIRGEVVRRYPELTVTALREQGEDGGRPLLPEAPSGSEEAATVIFQAPLSPDVMLVGLDVTVEELRSPGWWIVLSEHPQAPRFRRAEGDPGPGEVAFAAPGAAASGAAVARERLEDPTRIAFAADDFLPEGG